MTELLRAFVLLIKSGELGATDGRSLNILSPKLDQQGEIGRDELIALLFAGSKDPDGACRSFLSRLKAAAQQAAQQAEQRGEEQAAAMFRSITVARIKAKGGAARLRSQRVSAGDGPGKPGLSAGKLSAQHRLQTDGIAQFAATTRVER